MARNVSSMSSGQVWSRPPTVASRRRLSRAGELWRNCPRPYIEIARQGRTFWALMPQGRLLPLSWMVDPCLRSARPFGLVGPLRATSALAVTRMASGLPSI